MLILDEPTNHLDIESREALEDALRAFAGAVLLVSHDRALLDAVGTRTVAVEDGTLHSYSGGWPEYVRVRDERRALPAGRARVREPGLRPARARARHNGGCARAARPPRTPTDPQAAKRKTKRAAKPKGRRRTASPRSRQAEQAVEQAEAALRALEDELADPAAWATRYESAKSEARHTAARRAVEEAYARLETLID